jgi:hypothetical protein
MSTEWCKIILKKWCHLALKITGAFVCCLGNVQTAGLLCEDHSRPPNFLVRDMLYLFRGNFVAFLFKTFHGFGIFVKELFPKPFNEP